MTITGHPSAIGVPRPRAKIHQERKEGKDTDRHGDPGTPFPGCVCGGIGHGPEDHLWTAELIAVPTFRSPRQIDRDREDPSCPLYRTGSGRGSRRNVWGWSEVRAYISWIVARDLGLPLGPADLALRLGPGSWTPPDPSHAPHPQIASRRGDDR